MFYQDKFDDFIIENQICGISEKAIKLVSGRLSPFYVNWKGLLQDAYQTRRLISYILDFTMDNGIEVDTFYGVPEGATLFGALAQYELSKRDSIKHHVIAMGRAKPKEGYGLEDARDFVSRPKGKTVVIEDVVTVATNSMPRLRRFLEKGINVSGVVVLTNRMERRDDGLSVKEAIEQIGIPFYQMSSTLELLPQIIGRQKIKKSILKKVEGYYREYGIKEICLT